MVEFLALAQECAPNVAPHTLAAIVRVESQFNPYAIGVVGGRLAKQPSSKQEALATVKQLEANGWNFSLGVAQVNRHNLPKYDITYEQAFDTCTNLRVGADILQGCFDRASKTRPDPQVALQAALSCYYSGNFTRGFKPDALGKPSYVQKVLSSAQSNVPPIRVIPNNPSPDGKKPQYDKAAPAKLKRAMPSTAAGPATPPADNASVLVPAEQAPSATEAPSKTGSLIVF